MRGFRRFAAAVAFAACALLFSSPAAAADAPFARLFGVAAVPVPEAHFPADVERHWQRVLKAEREQPSLGRKSSRLPVAEGGQWLYFAGKAPKMGEMDLLRGVNVFFNRFPSGADIKNYGVEEYWAAPAEFFEKRSGDCEDYVLAKYFALRVFGYDDDRLRIVLLYSVTEKQHHAVLAVNTSKGVFILDNNVRPPELILPQGQFASRYIPRYMLNEKGRWVFEGTKP